MFAYYEAVEVASHEVASYDTDVEREDVGGVCHEIVARHAHVVEGIGHAVGESAHDEERYAEEQWEVLALTGERDGGRHDESAAYRQYSATKCAHGEASFENLLRRVLQRHRTASHHHRHGKTAHKIAG